MVKREKRLKKSIESLQKQIEIHQEKIEGEEPNKDTTVNYWLEEIKDFEKERKKREEILRKLKK